MELLFLLIGLVAGALGCWLAMRARFFEPLRAETERRARAEAQAQRVPELEARVAQLQITNTDLQAERRVLSEAQAKLLESFRALSAEALQANNQMFLDLADTALAKRQVAIDELVRPLKDSLTKVDGKIHELETARVSAYSLLTSQLQSLATETTSLVRALRAPATRGQWGELQLRRAVEMSGMVEYCDFRVQQTLYGEDSRLRPDMVVMLPNGRRMVVDSKTPLAAYLDAIEATDDKVREAKLRHHAAQVREHVTKLANKSYWAQFDPAPEFVILFLPGESFFSAALQHDPSLIEYGAEQRVLLATPTTLIALLRAVAHGWRQEKIAQNAVEISRIGRELYDRLMKLAEHFAAVGTHLDRATKSYNTAAGAFETRVLVSARRMKEKGVTVAEDIPEMPQIERTSRTISASADSLAQ
jgi:DNA recombination protein RmuC